MPPVQNDRHSGAYPTKTDALRIAERFRLRVNLEHQFARPVTLDALVDRYVEQTTKSAVRNPAIEFVQAEPLDPTSLGNLLPGGDQAGRCRGVAQVAFISPKVKGPSSEHASPYISERKEMAVDRQQSY